MTALVVRKTAVLVIIHHDQGRAALGTDTIMRCEPNLRGATSEQHRVGAAQASCQRSWQRGAGLARLGEGRVAARFLPGAVFLEQVPQGAA